MHPEVKKLGDKDLDKFTALIRVFENVFEMEDFSIPDNNYLQHLLEKDDFLVFVAMLDDKVVGGLTAYTLQQYYSTKPLVYLYDLAVLTDYQRQGIGKKLIAGITDYCKSMGVEEVFVQADEADEHAVAFYHTTGGTAEKVVHFNYPFTTK
jgi:GNAT superfamily N-acetyltransferase